MVSPELLAEYRRITTRHTGESLLCERIVKVISGTNVRESPWRLVFESTTALDKAPDFFAINFFNDSIGKIYIGF